MKKWLSNLFASFSINQSEQDPNRVWGFFGKPYSSAGVAVDEQSVLGLAPILNGCRLISNQMGRCDAVVYQDSGENQRQIAYDHRAHKLLWIEPDPMFTPFRWRKMMTWNYVLHGNGYSYYDQENNEANIVDPNRVTPTVVYREGLKPEIFYSVRTDSGNIVLRADQMIHIRNNNWGGSGLVGLGLIQAGAEALGLCLAQQRFASVFYSNGATFATVVKCPPNFKTAQEREDFRRQFDTTHCGIDNAHKVVITPPNTEIDRLSLNAEESQLLAMYPHIINTCSTLLGLPSFKNNGQVATSYSSILAEHESLYTDLYDAILTDFEQELEKKLLTEKEKRSGSHTILFDRSTLRTGDIYAEQTRYLSAYQAKAITLEECRLGLGFPTKIDPSHTPLTAPQAVTQDQPQPQEPNAKQDQPIQ